MGVGSSRVARSNSRKQQPQPKPEPVVPVLTTTQPSPPSLPTVVRSRTKYGIDEPEQLRAPPPPPSKTKTPVVQRSQSARSPESAARITERHAQRVRRAYGSEDAQFHQRSMTVPAPQPLRNPLPLPPKDYISKSDFSRVYYSNPRPFVPAPAEELIRSKTKGKGKVDTTAGRDVFVARADEPSSSFSSHSSASTTNPPQQVVTTPFGVLYNQQQQQINALQDPDHDKSKAKGGLFSSLFHSRRHSRSNSQPGHDPNASLTQRPSMQQSTSSAHRPISPPYMLVPRGAQQQQARPPPSYFYHPDAPGYGFTTFSPHKILYRKQLYPTAEHLYQSMKFLPSKGRGGEPALAERIRTISQHPADAVLEGRQLNKQARPDWKEMRTKWMDEIMYMKFAQHPNLRHELINTHPSELIFASPHDAFWGVGPELQGRNELGQSLGRVRTRILREMGR